MSILVNGSPTKQFSVERGLRQGDPLSPFLFNIVVEGLSRLLGRASSLDIIKWAVFGVNGVEIAHLQFADDTILFLKPQMEFLLNVKRILRCFELASGLKINYHKSCFVKFGKKDPSNDMWAAAFRCIRSSLPINHLGLSLGGNLRKEATWKVFINRIQQRMAPWKRNLISKGGRLVLIKAVFSNLSMYFMTVFRIPSCVVRKIERLLRGFFWDDGTVKRKIHTVDWASLCRSKRNGGLGIGRDADKGTSLMVKWIWRFGREESSLWKSVICAKYGLDTRDIFWKWNLSQPCSVFVQSVGKLFDDGSITKMIID
ncbi:hypothetical protein Ddye_001429 [Dipteronia dyeriana]|uniref:Reverse transcriptase domain-containing protein n=1 Tax=Dipteronia dyeriana TaxID=168575 RepID=A0AAD9XP80_9ROSI|nr:hypothetical protein Ddye_001429 [Dipteronia dyeriana]